MHFLTKKIDFPDVSQADVSGLLAIGGDLSEERLIKAYHSGIFPWFDKQDPILWWSPDPRFVLRPEKLKVSKSLKQLLKQKKFQVTFNKEFEQVIHHCAQIKREGQDDTWITSEMIDAYINLHKIGLAKSVEVWQEEQLVGGLYGVDLPDKKVFCGESMFTKVSNASRVGFVTYVNHLIKEAYELIDCQVYTNHLASFGAEEIPREVFMSYL